MTQLYVPRYDSLPRFTQFHSFFLKPHAGGAPLKSDHIQKLIIGKLGPAMSVPGPGRVKTQSVLWFPLLNRGGMMRGFVQEADRQQTTLLPECLDDWVGESNPVRAVDVFVDALELRDLGFDGVDPAATGRPAYHPSPML